MGRWNPPSSGLLRSKGWSSTDVSEDYRIFNGRVKTSSANMGPIRCPETSVLNQTTLRNNEEDEIIKVNRRGSLLSRTVSNVVCWIQVVQGRVSDGFQWRVPVKRSVATKGFTPRRKSEITQTWCCVLIVVYCICERQKYIFLWQN